MRLRRLAFWTGLLLGAVVGYVIGISLPEEKQKHLRETLVHRGEEVVDKARTVGRERARHLAEEAKRRAETVVTEARERVPEVLPFGKPKNGTEEA